MKRLATHDGAFHADDVMATAILKQVFPNNMIIRTRDDAVLNDCYIIYDVGFKYDGITRFDHHQPEKELRPDGTPYSSCGLVWRTYGKDYLATVYPSLTLFPGGVDKVHQAVDECILYHIDLADNGIKQGTTWDISKMISTMNPNWDNWNDLPNAFDRAVSLAGQILKDFIDNAMSKLRANDIVRSAFDKRTNPGILVLPIDCPWCEYLLELDKNEEVLYVIYPQNDGYVLKAALKQPNSFESRKLLPELWAGASTEHLNNIIGIKDAKFCHTGRFIAKFGSKESALVAATIALK